MNTYTITLDNPRSACELCQWLRMYTLNAVFADCEVYVFTRTSKLADFSNAVMTITTDHVGTVNVVDNRYAVKGWAK